MNRNDVKVFPVEGKPGSDQVGRVDFAFSPGVLPVRTIREYKPKGSDEYKKFETGSIIGAQTIICQGARLGVGKKGPYILVDAFDVPFDVRQQVAEIAYQKLQERVQHSAATDEAPAAKRGPKLAV